jgi:hypothetical protein
MRPTPTQIAAGVALLGAGGVAGAALPTTAASPDPVAAAPKPPEVRTQVVRRTVRIARHEHPKRRRRVAAAAVAPAAAAAPSHAPASAPVAPVAAPARPLVTRSSGAGHPAAHAPLRTRASATGGGEHEDGHESEREGDDD